MQREGAVGASAREADGEGRPRAAEPNGVSSAVSPREGAGRISG